MVALVTIEFGFNTCARKEMLQVVNALPCMLIWSSRNHDAVCCSPVAWDAEYQIKRFLYLL